MKRAGELTLVAGNVDVDEDAGGAVAVDVPHSLVQGDAERVRVVALALRLVPDVVCGQG